MLFITATRRIIKAVCSSDMKCSGEILKSGLSFFEGRKKIHNLGVQIKDKKL